MVSRGGIDPALGSSGESPGGLEDVVNAQASLLDETMTALAVTATRLQREHERSATLADRVCVLEEAYAVMHEEMVRLHEGISGVAQALVEQRVQAHGGSE